MVPSFELYKFWPYVSITATKGLSSHLLFWMGRLTLHLLLQAFSDFLEMCVLISSLHTSLSIDLSSNHAGNT